MIVSYIKEMNGQEGKAQIKKCFYGIMGFKYGIYIINWKEI